MCIDEVFCKYTSKKFGVINHRKSRMNKLKKIIVYLVSGYLLFWLLVIYKFTEPNLSTKECEVIRQNFDKIKLGMSNEEVLLLIYSEPESKIYPYSEVFPEQKIQWEIWLLCADLNSCIVTDSGRKQCYEWQMVAFDSQTGKVVKVFYDNPERVGFS